VAVRKRGRRWAVEVYDSGPASRKRYVGTFDTQRQARAKEGEALALAASAGGPRSNETVAGLASYWLELRPRQKEATNAAYRDQVKPFVDRYGKLRLTDIDRTLAYSWLSEKRWTHGGIRAMFSDGVRLDLVATNPFSGLRLSGTRGRKDIDVLTVAEVHRLAGCAANVWDGEVALTVRALVLVAAFTGMRPAELYGLRWADLDLRDDLIGVQRQYSAKSRDFELPKNGQRRTIVLTPPAREGLLDLPRPVRSDSLVFRASRGGPLTGRVQHYYWNPVRCSFGRPSMDLYELRHFCGSWLLNDLELPPQDVAQQLGHTDGGALVQKLYGHPSERLARKRIKRATGGTMAEVAVLSAAEERQAES